jgi:hypothetical protein
MRRVPSFLMFLTAASILAPALAVAQSSTATVTGATTTHRGFGLGVAELLASGPTFPNILATWGDSGGRFHIDGLVGLTHTANTDFDLAIKGWYHVHAAPSADFSLGAGFGFRSYKPGPDRQTDFILELGAQIRAFIVSNVAMIGSVGMGVYLPDTGSSTIRFGGQLVGSLGVAYYFQ